MALSKTGRSLSKAEILGVGVFSPLSIQGNHQGAVKQVLSLMAEFTASICFMRPAHGVCRGPCGKVATGLEKPLIREQVFGISRAESMSPNLWSKQGGGEPFFLYHAFGVIVRRGDPIRAGASLFAGQQQSAAVEGDQNTSLFSSGAGEAMNPLAGAVHQLCGRLWHLSLSGNGTAEHRSCALLSLEGVSQHPMGPGWGMGSRGEKGWPAPGDRPGYLAGAGCLESGWVGQAHRGGLQ